MTAPTPPFLHYVGAPERRVERWLGWVALSAVFFLLSSIATVALLVAFDLMELVETAGKEALPDGPERLFDEARMTFVFTVSLVLTAAGVIAAARTVFGRPAWTFVTPARPFRLRLLAAGFVVFGVLVLLSLVVERMITGDALDPPVFDPSYVLGSRVLYALVGFVCIVLASAAEELVFRGVLLQITAGWTRRIAVLAVVNGIVFSAVHLDPAPDAFVARAASGAVWAWTVLRLAGLEFAIGAHFANNFVLLMLSTTFSEGTQVGRELPWPYLAGDVVITLTLAGVVAIALRSSRLRAWAGVQETLSPPAASTGETASPRDAPS